MYWIKIWNELVDYFYIYNNCSLRHLFCVSCGFHSLKSKEQQLSEKTFSLSPGCWTQNLTFNFKTFVAEKRPTNNSNHMYAIWYSFLIWMIFKITFRVTIHIHLSFLGKTFKTTHAKLRMPEGTIIIDRIVILLAVYTLSLL